MEADILPTTPETPRAHYETPTFQVISLDCEISSYAPDGDEPPLF